MGKLWLIISMLFLCGCAGFPCKECPIVAEVDSAEELHGCSLLKTFSYPGGDFIFGTPYMGDFKNEAIERAGKIGATHILYRPELDGNGIAYTNVVYAYKCPPGYEILRDTEEEY